MILKRSYLTLLKNVIYKFIQFDVKKYRKKYNGRIINFPSHLFASIKLVLSEILNNKKTITLYRYY